MLSCTWHSIHPGHSIPCLYPPGAIGAPSSDLTVSRALLLLSRFSRVRLCATPCRSPPGSSVHGIFQARALEWGAIAFSQQSPGTAKYHSGEEKRRIVPLGTTALQKLLCSHFRKFNIFSPKYSKTLISERKYWIVQVKILGHMVTTP